ncbi:hypothetical protein [Salmonirosea aquatica]|uniref:T9SS C-terminal target domain-containing protein n=1 Tax=Salmonirosea aquatica TaxID=2654236 RepID=A0A7C9BGK8_9BACT|nr:hypothetical protein [Cytophagaceae bacterium SJW1-29]
MSGNHGNSDYWVVKLDAAGGIVWQKALGGSGVDVATALTASPDGGYIVVGYTQSTDGDVSGNHGNSDYWVVKLDAAGGIVWQKALGGTGYDEAKVITASGDGGFVVAGFTYSTDGDVSGNHGNSDYWVVKLDSLGSIVWQKALGGTGYDIANALTASDDGGFVVAGFTESNNGDVAENQGNADYWVVRLDSLGGIVWQKALGGTDYDDAFAITASDDGGFVVAGFTESNDGDVSGNHGNADYWVVRLSATAPTVSDLSAPARACSSPPRWAISQAPTTTRSPTGRAAP